MTLWIFRAAGATAILTMTLVAGLAAARELAPELRVCQTKADCVVVDIGCGHPGTANLKHRDYASSQACDAALNFAVQSKRWSATCMHEHCVLLGREHAEK